MSNPYSKLDQAMLDLVEAYQALEQSLETKHGEDFESIENGIVEAFENAIDSAIEEHDSSTAQVASLVSSMSDAVEQLDPSAFEGEDDDELEVEDGDYDDIELEDDDLEDEDLEDD